MHVTAKQDCPRATIRKTTAAIAALHTHTHTRTLTHRKKDGSAESTSRVPFGRARWKTTIHQQNQRKTIPANRSENQSKESGVGGYSVAWLRLRLASRCLVRPPRWLPAASSCVPWQSAG